MSRHFPLLYQLRLTPIYVQLLPSPQSKPDRSVSMSKHFHSYTSPVAPRSTVRSGSFIFHVQTFPTPLHVKLPWPTFRAWRVSFHVQILPTLLHFQLPLRPNPSPMCQFPFKQTCHSYTSPDTPSPHIHVQFSSSPQSALDLMGQFPCPGTFNVHILSLNSHLNVQTLLSPIHVQSPPLHSTSVSVSHAAQPVTYLAIRHQATCDW